MTVQIIKGNLLDAFDKGEVNVIGHIVNCQGVMGSGIAKSIKERYPQVFNEYRGQINIAKKEYSEEDILGFTQMLNLTMV
jgi:O-acetyl-ADP-ribose deacetylase (regulator of RNase III)